MRMCTVTAGGLGLALGLAAAGTALAGGQQIAVEVAPDARSVLVRTYRCGTPAEIMVRGKAEGVVDGQRRLLRLKVARTAEPGVFSVDRQWPEEGTWVLAFWTEGGAFVNALVELQPGAPLRIASQESTTRKITADRVAAALRRRSGS